MNTDKFICKNKIENTGPGIEKLKKRSQLPLSAKNSTNSNIDFQSTASWYSHGVHQDFKYLIPVFLLQIDK
jgi:hypothetical protein